MLVKTSSWFTPLPEDHVRIGISRGTPRGLKAGYRRYVRLNPGSWFNAVPPAEYLRRYNDILAALDPAGVVEDLAKLAAGKTPVLCCFEDPRGIAEGRCWCHRSLVGKWLQDRLGITVQEVGYDHFDAWTLLRNSGIQPPTFR